MKPSCGTSFSFQVGTEAEGSGLGWGLDLGSGSGDTMHSEELLRVSVRIEGQESGCPHSLTFTTSWLGPTTPTPHPLQRPASLFSG